MTDFSEIFREILRGISQNYFVKIYVFILAKFREIQIISSKFREIQIISSKFRVSGNFENDVSQPPYNCTVTSKSCQKMRDLKPGPQKNLVTESRSHQKNEATETRAAKK